jgi:hypothetical protein
MRKPNDAQHSAAQRAQHTQPPGTHLLSMTTRFIFACLTNGHFTGLCHVMLLI